jgi:3-phenylpropionate/trans-cinnamate dioxygenase ferredoxin component
MRWIKIAEMADVPPGTGRTTNVEGRLIALFNVEGSFHALDDLCSHMGGSLGKGRLTNRQVICPWHGARFDVNTGRVMSPPAGSGVQSYAVRVEGHSVFVAID